MIIKYIKIIFPTLLLLFFLISCEEEIDVDFHPSDPRIVIEGQIQLDSLATVRITESKSFGSDNVYNIIDNAVVMIDDDNGNCEVLTQNAFGLYVAHKTKGVVGRTYYLTVKVDEEIYNSESTLPTFVPITTVSMYDMPILGYPFPMVTFQDPPIEENYYRCRYYVNGKRIMIDDNVIDTKDKNGFMVERTLPIYKNLNDDKDIVRGDLIRVELYSIDKNVYRYFEALNTTNNPASNIKGGALGYFSAYAVDVCTVKADW